MRSAQETKISEARQVLEALGMPAKLLNERSALVLLGFLDLRAGAEWARSGNPQLRVHGLMAFLRTEYGKDYAPNTRETIRKDTIHHLLESGLLIKNPDNPNLPTNSPRTVYAIEVVALDVLRTFGSSSWEQEIVRYRASAPSLRSHYAQERKTKRVPLRIPGEKILHLSPGGQSVLVKKILDDFYTNFTPNAEVVYVGDTSERFALFEESLLVELGVKLPEHGKLPDIVVFQRDKGWLVLIEAVESGGEVDAKRRLQLQRLFLGSRAKLVFVSAFKDRRTFKKYLSNIAWETEVWIADDPGHLIHFDGERYLGPYE